MNKNNFWIKLIIYGLFFCCSSNNKIQAYKDIDKILESCCIDGEQSAKLGKSCSDVTPTNINKLNIPTELISLCFFSSEICCSKELRIEQCKMGVLAAKDGQDCHLIKPLSSEMMKIQQNTSEIGKIGNDFYKSCCEACKIGLVIGASSNDDCSLEPFTYGLPFDDSFNYCCNEMKAADAFYLTDTDDKDLCSRFDRLCSQICENTEDSYICRCHEGYRLLDDNITCVKISPNDNSVTSFNEKCIKGYSRVDENSKDCVDVNECETGEAVCDIHRQVCFNTPGSYKCLDILQAKENCPNGFRYNLETDQCDDIDECSEQTNICNEDTETCVNTKGGFNCQTKVLEKCIYGFRYNPALKGCQDIDECLEYNPCPSAFECINSPGGYDCEPLKKKNPLIKPTTNITCSAGFKPYLTNCIDIDECATDRHSCDSNQICTNLPGAYQCSCKNGFTLDKVTNACVDVNECQINNHDCLETQRCDNTIGSYTCIRLQSCGTGYTLNAGTGNCDDDDECELNTHNCIPPYECRNTKGSFRCDKPRFTTVPPSQKFMASKSPTTKPTSSISPTSIMAIPSSTSPTIVLPPQQFQQYSSSQSVPHVSPSQFEYATTPRSNYRKPQIIHYVSTDHPSQAAYSPHQNARNLEYDQYLGPCGIGFERNSQGACADLDECYIINPCRRNQRCINTNGSYRCQNLLTCSGGYMSNDDGTQCIDINECETNEANCGPDQICRNKLGGYTCSCPTGHLLNANKRCEDINECEFYTDQVCPVNTLCINTIGSYRCECKSGFKKEKEDDKICVDIDECQEISGLCGQRCINYWGTYRCACDSGYRLSENNRTCQDIDECEKHKSYNLCMGICDNIPGSYRCTCPEGYRLGADGRSCQDIDECEQSICRGYNQICTNTRGSYRCTTITCPHDFIIDPDRPNRCKRTSYLCDRDDLVCRQKPTSYTYNFITLVSNLSIPPQGRGLFSLKGPNFYENIDFDLRIVNIQAPHTVRRASEHSFSMHKMQNEVLLSLMESLEGPQEIEIALSMTVFMAGQPSGSNIAKIFIIVSEFPY